MLINIVINLKSDYSFFPCEENERLVISYRINDILPQNYFTY